MLCVACVSLVGASSLTTGVPIFEVYHYLVCAYRPHSHDSHYALLLCIWLLSALESRPFCIRASSRFA